MNRFTHLDAAGQVRMVDVTEKAPTVRSATAEGFVRCSEVVLAALRDETVPKGDVFALARIAGIAGAKRCAELLPLAHIIGVHGAVVDVALEDAGVRITATVRTADRTGVEMEALTAVSIAALSVVDMVKGLDKSVTIERIALIEKTGGKSGTWRRSDADARVSGAQTPDDPASDNRADDDRAAALVADELDAVTAPVADAEVIDEP